MAMFLLACDTERGSDKTHPVPVSLSTETHEMTGVRWEGSRVEVDWRWRFLSSKETTQGFQITGAWEFTLHNLSPDTSWVATVHRLSFKDDQGFQVAEYAPRNYVIRRRKLSAQDRDTLSGNFQFHVAKVELANSITHMNAWASFREARQYE